MYDVYNDTVIDLKLNSTNSERKIYCEQFDHLQENDIVIHDRGYFIRRSLG